MGQALQIMFKVQGPAVAILRRIMALVRGEEVVWAHWRTEA